jgi:hypothetical protein
MVRTVTMFATAVAAVALAAIPAFADDGDPTWAELEAMGLEAPHGPEEPVSLQGGRAIVPATLVLQEGDIPTGAPAAVTALNSPFTNGNGTVGFTGSAGENFVWYDGGIVWLNSDALPVVLSGAEGTMGVSDTGGFIYSPSVAGDDGVWTHNGLLLVEGVAAPGYAPPTTVTFNSRPHMLPGGASYWIAGVSYSGGTSSEGRVLYTSSDSTPATITPVIASDDLVGGLAIDRPSGVDFDYQISDDGSHHIHVLLLDTGSTTDDGIVYVDGGIIARETFATGAGDNWDNFDNVSINDSGDFLFSGDTDGATGSDEFVAYNGTIAIREGDTIGGINLTSSATVNTLSLNNLGHAAMIWTSAGAETLFFACDASDLVASTVAVLTVGDEIDLDGNGVGDATVTDFNASSSIGPGLWLAENGRAFVEVDLDYGAGELEAIIGLDLPSCGAGHLVINEVDYDQASTDDAEFLEIFNGTGATVNLGGYQVELVNGTGGGAAVYQTIDLPAVDLPDGDFFVVCANPATTFNCDLDVSPDTNLIQNGAPDAVALRDPTGLLVDTVSYEGDTGAPYTEGSGVGLEDDPSFTYFGISRYPDGIDTDVNNVDFGNYCHSPGLPNLNTTGDCLPIPVELMSFSIE